MAADFIFIPREKNERRIILDSKTIGYWNGTTTKLSDKWDLSRRIIESKADKIIVLTA